MTIFTSAKPAASNMLRVILVALVASAAAGLTVAYSSIPVDALLLAGIGITLLGALMIRARGGRLDPFDPIVLFSIAYGVMFFVRPAAMILTENFLQVRLTRTIDVSATFTEMLVLAAVGGAAFAVAYCLPAGRALAARLPTPVDELDVGQLWGASLSLVLVGGGLFALFIFSLGGAAGVGLLLSGRSLELQRALYDASSYLVHGPFLLVPAALVLGAAGLRYRRRGMLAAAAIVAVVVVLIGGPTGSRIMLLPLFGGSLAYLYIARRRRPGLIGAAGLLVAALLVSTFLLVSREASVRQHASYVDVMFGILAAPATLLEPLVEGEDASMAPYLAAALTHIPEDIPHAYGRAIVGDFFTRPIPRQIWPEKPLSPREQIVSSMWPIEWAYNIVNPEFSVLLLFYLDFGVFGVLTGMAVYGIAWRALYEYYQRFESSFVARLVFAITLPFMVIALRDNTVDTLIRAAIMILPAVLILRFARVRATVERAARSRAAIEGNGQQ